MRVKHIAAATISRQSLCSMSFVRSRAGPSATRLALVADHARLDMQQRELLSILVGGH